MRNTINSIRRHLIIVDTSLMTCKIKANYHQHMRLEQRTKKENIKIVIGMIMWIFMKLCFKDDNLFIYFNINLNNPYTNLLNTPKKACFNKS